MSDGYEHALDSAEGRRTALYSVLGQVPPGKVVSYGQLAELAGLGRAARWVGRTLGQLPVDTRLPWHRVLAAGGRAVVQVDGPDGQPVRSGVATELLAVLKARLG